MSDIIVIPKNVAQGMLGLLQGTDLAQGPIYQGFREAVEAKPTETHFRIACKSVLGGWQTVLVETFNGKEHEYLLGPVFNKTTDLWDWQQRAKLRVGDPAPASTGDKFYAVIASLFDASKRCEDNGNLEWFDKHSARIEALVKEHAPSGSGFDNGTTLDFMASRSDRLVFNTAFHHMDEHGYYDGWTEHTVIIKPSLQFGFDIAVTGRDRNEIKTYIIETFSLLGEVLIPRPHNAA